MNRKSSWQKFLQQHAGKGYSKSKLSEMYKRQKSYSPQYGYEDVVEDITDFSYWNGGLSYSPASPRNSKGVNTWTEFLKSMGGRGYSRKELSQMYKKQKSTRQRTRKTMTPTRRPIRRPLSPTRRPIRRPLTPTRRPIRRPLSPTRRPIRRPLSPTKMAVRRPIRRPLSPTRMIFNPV